MAESAAQLFSRLGGQHRLGTLRNPLFSHIPSGLKAKDVIELCGEEGSGKTELLLNIAAECVLPKSWRGRELGKGLEIVWLCTDFKFDLLRLVAILEGQVHETMKRVRGEENTEYSVPKRSTSFQRWPEDENFKKLIVSCLGRVHVIHCTSTNKLSTTLQYLRLCFLPKHPEVCGLVLDNVAEFCWPDRVEAGSVQGGKMRQKVWVDALEQLLEEHHLVVFAARPLLFSRNNQVRKGGEMVSVVSGDMMCLLWQQMVRYRFILHTFSESNPLNPHPIAHSTHYTPTPHAPPLHVPLSHVTVFTIQQVLPATSVSYKFTVSLIGVKFLS